MVERQKLTTIEYGLDQMSPLGTISVSATTPCRLVPDRPGLCVSPLAAGKWGRAPPSVGEFT